MGRGLLAASPVSAIPDRVDLSPNFNDFPLLSGSKTVVIHATRSGVSLNPSEFEGTLNYMRRPGTTSSHWVIARNGTKARVVPNTRQAWHAQEDNDNAWGIELEQGDEEDGFTPIQIAALAEVCRDDYLADFGVPPVHARTSTEPGFIGHQETAQGKRNGKSDPGHKFDWELFLHLLQWQERAEETPMIWARLKDRPENVTFRTYLLYTAGDGLHSRFVPNFEEHQALEESGVAGPLVELSIQTLRQFRCQPDPLS